MDLPTRARKRKVFEGRDYLIRRWKCPIDPPRFFVSGLQTEKGLSKGDIYWRFLKTPLVRCNIPIAEQPRLYELTGRTAIANYGSIG